MCYLGTSVLNTLTEIFQSEIWQIRFFTVFRAVSFVNVSQLSAPVPDF